MPDIEAAKAQATADLRGQIAELSAIVVSPGDQLPGVQAGNDGIDSV